MKSVPRADFLPEEVRELAEVDRALPIGYEQTNSQPRTVAKMLHLLDLKPGHSVLDLGAGSGWTTALLGHLVGEKGAVLGVEIVPELALRAAEAVAGFSMPWVQVRQSDSGVLGAPDDAPFDRILVSADAQGLPRALVDQLSPEGVMVIPVRSRMLRVVRKDGGRAAVSKHGYFSFVPLL